MDYSANEDTMHPQPKTKKDRIDQFIVDLPENWEYFFQEIKDTLKINLTAKTVVEKLKINTKTIDDFRVLQKYFIDNIVQFQCLDPIGSRPRKNRY